MSLYYDRCLKGIMSRVICVSLGLFVFIFGFVVMADGRSRILRSIIVQIQFLLSSFQFITSTNQSTVRSLEYIIRIFHANY